MAGKRECACCGSSFGGGREGYSLLDNGTPVRFKPGTPEAKEDPGVFSYCGMCLEYEFDPDLMEVYRPAAAPQP